MSHEVPNQSRKLAAVSVTFAGANASHATEDQS